MDHTLYFFNVSSAHNVEINATIAQIAERPQEFFQGGDLTWMMTSSALVFLMVPGLALFYSGISDRRLTLSMAWLPVMTSAVVGMQWYLWGYATTFSNWPSSQTFWGGSDGIALHNVLLRPVPATEEMQRNGPYIPELLYALFQGMFASFTASLVSGAAMWKDRPGHFLVFILFWATFVYSPIARWTWSPDGWANKWGVLDFAGGTAVHINAGATALAHCVFHLSVLPPVESLLSRLFGVNEPPSVNGVNGVNGPGIPPNPPSNPQAHQRPSEHTEAYNLANVVLGTVLLWIGWFGFNGGSALGANLRAVSACVSTHLAACSGGVTLCLLRSLSEHYFAEEPNPAPPQGNLLNNPPASAQQIPNPTPQQGPRPFAFSIAEFCNGAIIGLVCITPAAGYVPHQIAPLFGVLSTLVCSQLTPLSDLLHDTQNIIVVHGIAGLVGMLMTGVFARGQVAALDGVSLGVHARGGWDGHWRQLLLQFADSMAVLAYAFGVTMAILIVLEPFMFLARQRWLRGGRGWRAVTKPVVDRGTIREEIPYMGA